MFFFLVLLTDTFTDYAFLQRCQDTKFAGGALVLFSLHISYDMK
jgi:hypothetical protein